MKSNYKLRQSEYCKRLNDGGKILVTGGAGFIGSHIVDTYIDVGHQVAVVDNLSTGKKENLNPQAKFYYVDLLDRKKLEDIFKKEKPEIVNHQAAQVSAAIGVKDPVFDAQNNIIGGINLLQLCAKYKVKKIIYASSAAVYGEPQYLPVDEKHPCKPQTPYGISKYTLEHYIKFFAKVYDFNYLVLRYANVYGPRQNSKGEAGVVALFINRLLNQQIPLIFGKGYKTRDYVYVDDIAQANLLALTARKSNRTYNLGSGKETSDLQLFLKISEFFNPHTPRRCVKVKNVSDRPGDIQHFIYNSIKAKKELDWEARIKLEKGIAETINYYQIQNSNFLNIEN